MVPVMTRISRGAGISTRLLRVMFEHPWQRYQISSISGSGGMLAVKLFASKREWWLQALAKEGGAEEQR